MKDDIFTTRLIYKAIQKFSSVEEFQYKWYHYSFFHVKYV